MYVGGSVWAMDWCPRIHEDPDSHVKCEVHVFFVYLFAFYDRQNCKMVVFLFS